ncbi:beta-glucosidase [Kushneria sinocarnis]|uniref:Beta-glucosidase n=1 Tax=Kushneria sinocarnis TaxID=595502 RepID=A0A420X1L0_9GAMM|nr:glycoside hydrolase family 3 C-terminal domain-containing protein [Kushneria sinocarnis]RKR07565.1 beta-glucosidase [Kushneria sinocarnis]
MNASQHHAMSADAAEIETRIDTLLGQMTLAEKLDYIGGELDWDVKPRESLGLPRIRGTDASLGVRFGSQPGVGYPAGQTLASSWNLDLAKRYGRALGFDTREAGFQQILGPGLNLYRMPYGGRAFEHMTGEEPMLGSVLAAAAINGIQSRGVWCSVKHLTANNQETNRFYLDEIIDERTLREHYLLAFESVVKNAHPASIMATLNRVNGDYGCENAHILSDILKGDWQYQGLVESDYNGIIDGLKAAQAGTDIDRPTGYRMNAETLMPALEDSTLEESIIDDKVRRIMRQILRFGFDEALPEGSGEIHSAESQRVALEIARQGIVLLRNEPACHRRPLLPLNRQQRIAVVGELSRNAPPTGFGSANIDPVDYTSELDGLRDLAGDGARVDFIESLALNPRNSVWFTLDDAGEEVRGLHGAYYATDDFDQAEPTFERIEPALNWDFSTNENVTDFGTTNSWNNRFDTRAGALSARFTGFIRPELEGDHVFKVRADGPIRLWVDDELILDAANELPAPTIPDPAARNARARALQAGRAYRVVLEYTRRSGFSGTLGGLQGVQMSWASLAAPAALADYDAVIVAAGNSAEYEGEAFDHDFELPEFQAELIESIASRNPHTVVVLHGGTGLAMDSWLTRVGAVLHAWYPGQHGGRALAEILYGDISPSGRLPISIERTVEDNPAHGSYPAPSEAYGDDDNAIERMVYSEGLDIGYRGYDRLQRTPLFPFGFGLSYSRFELEDFTLLDEPDGRTRAVGRITNVGDRAAAEVIQLYVGAPEHSEVERPLRVLRAFTRVMLQPGETRFLSLELHDRALARFDPDRTQWIVDAGCYPIEIGTSCRHTHTIGFIERDRERALDVHDSNPLADPATVRI